MKPKVGQWVHYTIKTGEYHAALIVETKPKSGDSVMFLENDWDVTLEVHTVLRRRDGTDDALLDIRPNIFTVERARFTTAHAGLAEARGSWSWPVD